jgi:hypothetical protein
MTMTGTSSKNQQRSRVVKGGRSHRCRELRRPPVAVFLVREEEEEEELEISIAGLCLCVLVGDFSRAEMGKKDPTVF